MIETKLSSIDTKNNENVATRHCSLFFHVLLCIKLVIALAFFHMRILSAILVSASRYVIFIREF